MRNLFDPRDVDAIIKILPSMLNTEDKQTWNFTKFGTF